MVRHPVHQLALKPCSLTLGGQCIGNGGVVLVQRESDFSPTALRWLPGSLATRIKGELANAAPPMGLLDPCPRRRSRSFAARLLLDRRRVPEFLATMGLNGPVRLEPEARAFMRPTPVGADARADAPRAFRSDAADVGRKSPAHDLRAWPAA